MISKREKEKVVIKEVIFVRGVPLSLKRKFRQKCESKGVSMSKMIHRLIKKLVETG